MWSEVIEQSWRWLHDEDWFWQCFSKSERGLDRTIEPFIYIGFKSLWPNLVEILAEGSSQNPGYGRPMMTWSFDQPRKVMGLVSLSKNCGLGPLEQLGVDFKNIGLGLQPAGRFGLRPWFRTGLNNFVPLQIPPYICKKVSYGWMKWKCDTAEFH